MRIILFIINYLFAHRCFQVLLFNTDHSIKHQPFVYRQLNDQIVLFQTIQFCISHSFALSLNVEHKDQVLLLRARVDMGVMAMKGYTAFLRAPELLESHHLISYPGYSLGGVLLLCSNEVGVLYSPT